MLEELGIDEATLRKALAEGPPLVDGMTNEEAVDTTMKLVKGELQLKHIRGITDEEMEAAYANGFNIFQGGNFEKAEKMFEFLATLDNQEKKYLTALGACRFNQKNYIGAIAAYSVAVMIDVDDPGLILKVAQCHLGLGDKETAMGALEAALEVAGDKPEHATAKSQCQALMDVLKDAG